ncbi:hypothetical protein MKY20_20240 [Cytobacillus sp. FSL W8-0315]
MSELVTVKVVAGEGWEGLRRETLYINEQEVMYPGHFLSVLKMPF